MMRSECQSDKNKISKCLCVFVFAYTCDSFSFLSPFSPLVDYIFLLG